MSDPITAALIMAGTTAATTGAQIAVSEHQQKKALEEQRIAQAEANAKQQESENKAERQRLEALAGNAAATDYGNVWGVDSNKYADAAQKLSAGTGDFGTDDDEYNPFYTRGLL